MFAVVYAFALCAVRALWGVFGALCVGLGCLSAVRRASDARITQNFALCCPFALSVVFLYAFGAFVPFCAKFEPLPVCSICPPSAVMRSDVAIVP